MWIEGTGKIGNVVDYFSVLLTSAPHENLGSLYSFIRNSVSTSDNSYLTSLSSIKELIFFIMDSNNALGPDGCSDVSITLC